MSVSLKRISELGHVVTGKTPPTSRQEFFGGEYLFITPSDLDYNHYYCRETERTVTEEARLALPNQFIPADAVMFTCIGATIGKCGIAPSECITNQQINSVVANEHTNPKFLYYLLCHNIEHVKQMGGGSATPIVCKSKFEDTELLSPDLRAQRIIANILSSYDDLIENNSRRIKLLEESARLLYQEWFVRLRFPGYEHTRIVDGVPDGWEKKKLKSLGKITTGKTPPTKRKEYFGGNIPFIKTPDMHGNVYVVTSEDTLSDEGAETQEKKFLNKNAIIVACIGAKAGVVSLTSNKSQTNQQINAISVHEDTKTFYLYFFLKDFKEQLLAIGSSGSTMPNVSKGKFENIDVLVPPKRLLSVYHEIASTFFEQILNLQLSNQKLKAARDLLLPRLMNGEIAV